jgi:hypothetical protein
VRLRSYGCNRLASDAQFMVHNILEKIARFPA